MGRGRLWGIPLSRWANVYCSVSFLIYPNRFRQLLTFRFFPYLLESHAIFNMLPDGDDTLPNGSVVFEGTSTSGGVIGAVVRPSSTCGGCSTPAERAAAAQIDTQKHGDNSMFHELGKYKGCTPAGN